MAKLTDDQVAFAEALSTLYQLIRAQLEDEDPGEIDGDDALEILMAAPAEVQKLVLAVGNQPDDIGIANLLVGAGAGFFNAHIDEFREEVDQA